MNRVQWTSSEKRQIAQSVSEQLAKNPTQSIIKAVNLAQAQFHESRRRNITTVIHVPWLDQEISNLKREVAADLRLASEAVPLQPPAIPQVQPIDPASLSDDALLRECLSRFASHLTPLVLPIVEQVMTKAVTGEAMEHAMTAAMSKYLKGLGLMPKAEQRSKKRMVLLVGLKPTQFNQIEHDYGDLFDFRLWNGANESVDRLKSLCSQAFRIFVMTDFGSHADTTVITSINKPAYRPFSGGVSTLSNLIEDLYASC